MLKIQENLNTINCYAANRTKIQYIVVHYTANTGTSATAYGNTVYFKTYRAASAHYFVDNTDIWRCVADKDIAWHCGGGLQGTGPHPFYGKCTNDNSIGVELVSRSDAAGKNYYIPDQTISNGAELVRYLMKKYNVPISNVIRHYDVTAKMCPLPMINENEYKWTNFKNMVMTKSGNISDPSNPNHMKADLPDVFYQAYAQYQWWDPVKNCDDYAGVENQAMSAIMIRLSNGSVMYRVHIKGGSWLAWTTNHTRQAGSYGMPIDGIQIKPATNSNFKLVYRVSTVGTSQYSDWVVNDNGYAGTLGLSIDKLQIKAE